MSSLNLLKKTAILSTLILSTAIFADLPLALVGGSTNPGNVPFADHISTSNAVSPINLGITSGGLNMVAMNAFGQGIVGGFRSGPIQPYAALISPSGEVTLINLTLPPVSSIFSVSINDSGNGIIGGANTLVAGQPAYAALVSPSGDVLPINTFSNNRIISVSINNSNQAVIGGQNSPGFAGPAYAALVSPSGIATPINLGIANGSITWVAINASGNSLIGGRNNTTLAPYVALVSSSGVLTPINPGSTNGTISKVAYNDAGQGIAGGRDFSTNFPYVLLVSPSGTGTVIDTGVGIGLINEVDINQSGTSIIGGRTTVNGPAYAAFVSPSGTLTTIDTGLSNGVISSVAINDFGQALIGGATPQTAGDAYLAIVSPAGIVTPINLGLTSAISFVASIAMLNQIPTSGLSGNNLRFADFINDNAPQDAFYFVPAFFDGSLSDALASAAPTRNAISQYTASRNLFYLTNGISNHIRNRSMWIQMRDEASTYEVDDNWKSPDQLQTSCCLQKPKDPCEEGPTNSVWFEALGAFAYQKAQRQTPGFHPSSGGAILAYDGKTSRHTRMGIGVTYLYTHIHQYKNAGHNNINQEDLFVYGSWENKHFYADASLLGGLFQTHQVRNIKMTGFSFKAKSHVHGWQLLPHLELGYHYTRPCGIHFTVNPFVMVDWANAWQHKYKEKGSGPFNAGQKSHHSSLLRTEASLRFYETIFYDCWNLIFQEKIGYVNVHSFKAGRMNTFLVGSPGSFTVSTLTSNQNLGVGEFAMIFSPQKLGYPTTTIFYQGEFGSKYQSHQVALELAWDF